MAAGYGTPNHKRLRSNLYVNILGFGAAWRLHGLAEQIRLLRDERNIMTRCTKEFSVSREAMTYDQAELVKSFQAFLKEAEQGAVIPPVSPQDLKWLHELCVERAKRYCGKDGVLSLDSMARACNPTANVPAVWLRHTQLRTLYRHGLLTAWQHGTTLDDAVFEIAATIPFQGVRLDQEAFLRELRQRMSVPEPHPQTVPGR